MKKEDLKKHLEEENPDLSQENHKLIFSLLFLFSFSLLSAQVNTNGFLNVDFIDVQPELNRIYDLDYDNDKLIDLLLINRSNRDYSLIRNLFTKDQRILSNKFWISLNSITKFKEENNINFYLLTSRKDKSASLVFFTNYGSLIIKSRLELNSYPSKVFTADFRNSGRTRAVIYGPAFSGLSLISEKNFELSAESITEKHSYIEAFPNDFNGDGYKDIAALNAQNNSLEFFSNDQEGKFFFDREFKLGRKEIFQTSTDVNNDGFLDFITTENNSIIIRYGDSVYSFTNINKVDLDEPVKKVIAADVNYNNTKDLIFINGKSDKIYISFSTADGNYQQPICVLDSENLEDIRITRKGILNRLLAVDSSGKLFSISYIKTNDEKFRISFTDSVSNLFSADNFFGAISAKEQKLLIAEDSNGFFNYHSYSISEPANNAVIENRENSKMIYLFSKGEKFLEALELDEQLNQINKKSFYFEKNINDVVVDKKFNQTYAFLEDSTSLYMKSFSMLKNNQVLEESDDYLVTKNHVSSSIVNTDTTFISYITTQNDNLYYNLSSKFELVYKDIRKVEIGNKEDKVYSKAFNRNKKFFSITNINHKKEYLIDYKNELKKYTSDFYFNPDRLKIIPYKNRDRFIYLDEKTRDLYWVKVSIAYKLFVSRLLLKDVKTKDFAYFLYNKHPMIVYFDSSTKLLNFRRIPFDD